VINGKSERAYLPNPGRLWELLRPGAALVVIRNRPGLAMPYTVMAVLKEGIPVLLHTHLTNTVVEALLREGLVPGLEDAEIVKREATVGHSRYDFLLQRGGKGMILEVKNCTLFGERLAMFPDAITARGSRHLLGLKELAEKGTMTGVLFVVQWPFAEFFLPEYHTDLEFSRHLMTVHGEVLVKAIALRWYEDLTLDSTVRELAIPWEYLGGHLGDRGSYIVILHLDRDQSINIGGLGDIFFRAGFYLYVGSAKGGITQRIARHSGKRKRHFWHIDYLRQQATFHKGLPIRTNLDLECPIAESLGRIADWSVKGFGSSDCSCDTHLFGMHEDPVKLPIFIDLLLRFRIGLVEDELSL
jgi:sugar fermentation stimulation protein A